MPEHESAPPTMPTPPREPSAAAPSAGLRARTLVRDGLAELPPPGGGRTAERWAALRSWGAGDLSLAKILESHADALAILRERGSEPAPGALYAVWASGLGGGLSYEPEPGGYHLFGTLRFASAACDVDRALVAARNGKETLLFDVDLREPGVTPVPGTWFAVGMADTASLDVEFDVRGIAADRAVGPASWYLERPGFWIGAIGVSAVWTGAVDALIRTLSETLAATPEVAAHRAAHLGACLTVQRTLDALFASAADEVDARPDADHQQLADIVRTATEAAAQEVLTRVGRALGAGPLGKDHEHARRTADLPVYLRQHHAERDLERIGRTALAGRSGAR